MSRWVNGITTMCTELQKREVDVDLEISVESGTVNVRQYHGRVVLLAITTSTICSSAYLAHLLQTFANEYGDRGFQPLLALINLLPGDDRPTLGYSYPIGSASRNSAARMLGVPSDGFRVPQFLFIDRGGRKRAHYDIQDSAFCLNFKDNARQLIERLVSAGKKDT